MALSSKSNTINALGIFGRLEPVQEKYFKQGIIETHYTKVVWFVPKENQEEASKELKKVKEMVFYDFILVANRQNDENTIYFSKRLL